MDITDATQNRIDVGIDLLLEGHSVIYHEVVFHIDQSKKPRELAINSYSDYEPNRVTEKMATEKIERSKHVGEALAEKSSDFRTLWETLPHVYAFCWDYGMGAVAIVEQRNENMRWIAKKT